MQESLRKCNEEMKRADHLIYVSLKYTRTVDVIKHIIERMCNACDYLVECLFRYISSRGIDVKVSEKPIIRLKFLKEFFKDDEKIVEFCDFYIFLRKIKRSEYEASKEFRRHVTMSVFIDGKKEDITIDKIYEFYDKLKEFFQYIKEKVGLSDE